MSEKSSAEFIRKMAANDACADPETLGKSPVYLSGGPYDCARVLARPTSLWLKMADGSMYALSDIERRGEPVYYFEEPGPHQLTIAENIPDGSCLVSTGPLPMREQASDYDVMGTVKSDALLKALEPARPGLFILELRVADEHENVYSVGKQGPRGEGKVERIDRWSKIGAPPETREGFTIRFSTAVMRHVPMGSVIDWLEHT